MCGLVPSPVPPVRTSPPPPFFCFFLFLYTLGGGGSFFFPDHRLVGMLNMFRATKSGRGAQHPAVRCGRWRAASGGTPHSAVRCSPRYAARIVVPDGIELAHAFSRVLRTFKTRDQSRLLVCVLCSSGYVVCAVMCCQRCAVCFQVCTYGTSCTIGVELSDRVFFSCRHLKTISTFTAFGLEF